LDDLSAMDKQSRRDAVRDYKERKVPVGIFSLRCLATGETWVGASRNLEGQKNSLTFMLRMGSHFNRALQNAWRDHGGEAGFEFAVVETLDDEALGPVGRDTWLKDRDRHWREALGAKPVVG
jgi:hypothetical protein